jgi:hypothetical protein
MNEEQSKKPIYKKWWVWVGGVIVIFILFGIFSGNNEKITVQEEWRENFLDPASESQVENVPIPNNTERADWETGQGPLVVQQEMYTVPKTSFSELQDWYQELMPKNTSWNNWRWCANAPTVGTLFDQRTYTNSSNDQLLVVVITADNPPGILVTVSNERC